jgi:hypothetical protein
MGLRFSVHTPSKSLRKRRVIAVSEDVAWRTVVNCLSAMGEFIEKLGLKVEDFQCCISEWVDSEVEGWRYLQFRITVLESGLKKLKGMDKFDLLKSLTAIADQTIPKGLRRKVTILVE